MKKSFSGSFEDSNDENRDDNSACYKPYLDDYADPLLQIPDDTPIIINVSETQYEIVRHVGLSLGYSLQESPDAKTWDIKWVDTAVEAELLSSMQPYQKINHYPGMYSLARKNHLGINLQKLAKVFPKDYAFFPKTWLLPAELNEFKKVFRSDSYYIVKPEAQCQGKGIFLINSLEQINKCDHYIAQSYLLKPYLIEGLKFDLRIYALVYGCEPMRIFVYNQGLARFATDKYEEPNATNCKNMYMHLTNYAINKNSNKFEFNQNSESAYTGHKRCLNAIWEYIDKNGGCSALIKQKIYSIIVKTVCTAEPSITHIYKSCQNNDYDNSCCFEILGFDIILDSNLNPILLEVNHSPSFTTDTPFDRKVKNCLIRDTMNILHFTQRKKRRCLEIKRIEGRQKELGIPVKETFEHKQLIKQKRIHRRILYENSHLGGYTVIFPSTNPEDMGMYMKYIAEAKNIWESFTGLKKNILMPIKKPFVNSHNQKRPLTTSNIIQCPKLRSSIKPIMFDDRIKDIQRIYKCKLVKQRSLNQSEGKKRRTLTIIRLENNPVKQANGIYSTKTNKK